MKRLLLLVPLLTIMAACGISNVPPSTNSTAVTNITSSVTNTVTNVQIKATVAMSLGELAFTSAEQTGTAALKSSTIPKSVKLRIGDLVLEARGYRNKARYAVDHGLDASEWLTKLSGTVGLITSLAKGTQ